MWAGPQRPGSKGSTLGGVWVGHKDKGQPSPADILQAQEPGKCAELCPNGDLLSPNFILKILKPGQSWKGTLNTNISSSLIPSPFL